MDDDKAACCGCISFKYVEEADHEQELIEKEKLNWISKLARHLRVSLYETKKEGNRFVKTYDEFKITESAYDYALVSLINENEMKDWPKGKDSTYYQPIKMRASQRESIF